MAAGDAIPSAMVVTASAVTTSTVAAASSASKYRRLNLIPCDRKSYLKPVAKGTYLIRSDDMRRCQIAVEYAMKIRVHNLPACARRLDQYQATRPNLGGDPCGNAVARHIPAVRQRIRRTKPARGGQDRDHSAIQM